MHKRRQAKRARTGKQGQGERALAVAPHEDHEDGLALSLIGDDVRGVGPDHAGTRQRDRHDVGSAAELIMAARLSKRLGISTVTLWRWRHDPQLGFPTGIRINDRVYFPWREVTAWLQRQQQTA